MKLELTLEEAQTLINLIDVAVRAQGLAIAQPAYQLFQRIKDTAEKSAPSTQLNPPG